MHVVVDRRATLKIYHNFKWRRELRNGRLGGRLIPSGVTGFASTLLPKLALRYGGIGYLRESYIFASASSILARTTFDLVAQLVRVPDCRSGGCGFESRQGRYGLVAQLVRAGNS